MFSSAILCKGFNVCEIIIPSNEAIFEQTMCFRIQLTFKMTDMTPGGYLLCDLNTASALALALATPHQQFSSTIQLFTRDHLLEKQQMNARSKCGFIDKWKSLTFENSVYFFELFFILYLK